jgi:hypothetical protein
MALQKLRADLAQRRSEESEEDKRVLGQVWKIRQGNPNATVADLPPSVVAYTQARGLGTHVDSILSQSNVMDDSRLYADLMSKSGNDAEGFANIDLTKFSGSLTQAHWNHLVEIQRSINKADTRAVEITKLQTQTVQNVRADMRAAGLDTGAKPGTNAAEKLAQFETSLHDTLVAENEARRVANKPPLSRDEARTLALGLLKDQALSGSGFLWDTHGPTYSVVDKIPAEERESIRQKLQAAGLAATPARIVDYYNRSRAK